MKHAIGVIPARYKSTRFPGKPLIQLLGQPMILWVCKQTALALGKENTYVATDDERIREVVEGGGYQCLMTEDAPTGTDRVWLASKQVDAKFYINVQGDEPMMDPELIKEVLRVAEQRPEVAINAMGRILEDEDPTSPNIPKVMATETGNLLYMSRLPIPGHKTPSQKPDHYYKQVCVYSFTKPQLEAFGGFGRKCQVELHEDIETLRFLEVGIPVHMIKTEAHTMAVDTPEDAVKVEEAMRAKGFSY